jgi:MscS family membrane protein
MKRRRWLSWIWSGWLSLCAAGVGWAVWTSGFAQEVGGNAGPVAGPTNAPGSLLVQKIANRAFVDSHQGELSFGLNEVAILQSRFLGNPLWQYVSTVLYVILAFGVSKGVDYVVKIRLQAWASRTANQWDDLLVRLVDGPVKVISFVTLLNIGLQLFDWPPVIEAYIARGTLIGLAFSVIYVLLKTIDAGAELWRARLKHDGDRSFNIHFVTLVGRAAKIVMCIIAVLTLLQNVGVNITALLGSVSVLGLALGLAAQDTVANLFGAVAVFLDQPFKVGDRIRIGTEVDGMVEEMGLRATRVRTVDGFLVTVPNKQVGNNTVTNVSARPNFRVVMDFGITYDTPADRVRLAGGLLKEIFGGHPATEKVDVHFNRFADSFLNLNVVWICKTVEWEDHTAILQELNLRVKERFDAEKLEFAYPTRTLHIRNQN